MLQTYAQDDTLTHVARVDAKDRILSKSFSKFP